MDVKLKKFKKGSKKARLIANAILESTKKDWIFDGDKVKLNYQRIIERKEYPDMQESYIKFVQDNRDTVFVAHPYRPRPDGFSALMELEGGSNWLFWYGDLVRVEKSQTEVVE